MKVNGVDILEATFAFPRVGVWHVDLDITSEDASRFIGDITIEGELGTFKARVRPGGAASFGGRVRAKAIGGKGGFAAPCEPKFYRSIPASTVLREVLAVGGEKLSGSSAGIDQTLAFWTRHEASVGEAFEELVDFLGLSWRVLDDGSVWVGTETWPEAKLGATAAVLEENATARTATLVDAHALRPGMTYTGRHVGRVELLVSGSIRTTAHFQEKDEGGDPVRVALTKIVRQMTRTIDFLALYPARVVSQNGDGTLELALTSERMPSMSRIPIRYGVPGVRAKVKAGSYVAVEFERGSPDAPVATLWDRESVTELTIKADRVVVDAMDVESQKGGRPLARVGDPVMVISTPPGLPAMGQIMSGNPRHRG